MVSTSDNTTNNTKEINTLKDEIDKINDKIEGGIGGDPGGDPGGDLSTVIDKVEKVITAIGLTENLELETGGVLTNNANTVSNALLILDEKLVSTSDNTTNNTKEIGNVKDEIYTIKTEIKNVIDAIPESRLPEWYQPSTETNENLSLAGGDSFVDAFSKLEKAIIDNELISTIVTENIAYSVGLNDKLQYVPTGAITSSSKNISEAIKLLDDYISTHTNSLNTNSLNTNLLNTYQQNYTETYEWKDGNPDNEDRTGYFVKLESGKLIKCSGSTGFILGITTSTNRKFSTVSLIGTNIINQDGTLVEGEYCTINKNGIATKTTTQKYYVLNIIDKNKAKIIFK